MSDSPETAKGQGGDGEAAIALYAITALALIGLLTIVGMWWVPFRMIACSHAPLLICEWSFVAPLALMGGLVVVMGLQTRQIHRHGRFAVERIERDVRTQRFTAAVAESEDQPVVLGFVAAGAERGVRQPESAIRQRIPYSKGFKVLPKEHRLKVKMNVAMFSMAVAAAIATSVLIFKEQAEQTNAVILVVGVVLALASYVMHRVMEH